MACFPCSGDNNEIKAFFNAYMYLALFIGVREVAEFGPMAGLAGAALAVAVWCHQQLKYVYMLTCIQHAHSACM